MKTEHSAATHTRGLVLTSWSNRMTRKGFTLIEALVTLVVAGVIATFAFPTLVKAVSRQGAWNARAAAISMYARARATALETGRPTTLSWTGDVALITATPRLLTTGSGSMDTVGIAENFSALYGVTVSGTPAASLTIDPRGLGTSASTTVFFTRNGFQDSVMVTGYGRVVK
jgi:prepilin-type N-terminal cleavage/methylation domain-containing protein